MHAVIRERLGEIGSLCEAHGVASLHVFGSAVGGDFDEAKSDLDFLVEFRPMEPGDLATAYFGLLEGLERTFGGE